MQQSAAGWMSESKQKVQARAAWRKKHGSWLRFSSECVWCGENFRFYAPLKPDGTHDSLRYCSRPCITEALWEDKRTTRLQVKEMVYLYVMKSCSIPAIARKMQCSTTTVSHHLRAAGTAMRTHTSRRTCKVKGCNEPAEKRLHSRRTKDGDRILCGSMCVAHRRKYFADWVRNKHHKMDPLIGTRKTETKPIPSVCPKCGRVCPSRRAAVACHNQAWRKVKQANVSVPAVTVERPAAIAAEFAAERTENLSDLDVMEDDF